MEDAIGMILCVLAGMAICAAGYLNLGGRLEASRQQPQLGSDHRACHPGIEGGHQRWARLDEIQRQLHVHRS